MSGGAAVKAENRGWCGRTQEPRSPGFRPEAFRPEGLALTAPGPQAPNKKREFSRRLAAQTREGSTPNGRNPPTAGFGSREPGPA